MKYECRRRCQSLGLYFDEGLGLGAISDGRGEGHRRGRRRLRLVHGIGGGKETRGKNTCLPRGAPGARACTLMKGSISKSGLVAGPFKGVAAA